MDQKEMTIYFMNRIYTALVWPCKNRRPTANRWKGMVYTKHKEIIIGMWRKSKTGNNSI